MKKRAELGLIRVICVMSEYVEKSNGEQIWSLCEVMQPMVDWKAIQKMNKKRKSDSLINR
jgi:hypothetical protein